MVEDVAVHDIFQGDKLNESLEEVEAQEKCGFKPTREFDPVSFSLPFNWNSSPFDHDHWEYQLSAMRPVVPYLRAYAFSKKAEYLHVAASIFLDWSDFYHKNQTGKYTWYNMSVGQRAARLACLISYIRASGNEQIAANFLCRLNSIAASHIEDLMNERKLSNGNHGLFQAHGLMALSRALENNKSLSSKARNVSIEFMEKLVYKQFSDEGMHLEHSSQYHYFGLRTIKNILSSGWYGNNHFFSGIKELANEAGEWFTRPDGFRIANGDSSPVKASLRDVGFHHYLPFSDWQKASVRLFKKSGYFFCKSTPDCPEKKSYMLFFSGSYHSKVHKHADDLHVELFDRGEPVLVDSGGYRSVRDSMRTYIKSPQAHNTISKVGGAKLGIPYGSCIKSFDVKTQGISVCGEISDAVKGFSHRREVFYAPGKYFLCLDDIFSKEPASFEQWWQFSPGFEHEKHDEGFILRNNKIKIRVFSSMPSTSVSFFEGEANKAGGGYQGWVTVKGGMVPALSMCVKGEGKEIRFLTRICFKESFEKESKTILESLDLKS